LSAVQFIHREFLSMSFFLAGLLLGLWGLPIGPVRSFQMLVVAWLEKSGKVT